MAPVISIVLADNQRSLLTVNHVLDALGNKRALAGPAVLTADDPTSLLITPGDDSATPPTLIPNSFWIEPVQSEGHLGLFTGKLTDGVAVNAVAITVNAGPETADSAFDVTVGDPQPIPVVDAGTGETPPQGVDGTDNPAGDGPQ